MSLSTPESKATTTGLRYIVLKEGHGAQPKSGEMVKVLYKGMFFDGKVFDQKSDASHPFAFRLGRGEIIRGWEEGIAMMRVSKNISDCVKCHDADNSVHFNLDTYWPKIAHPWKD